MNIHWEGAQFVTHSLALINREHCYNLIKAGHDVTIFPYEKDQYEPKTKKELLLWENDIKNRDCNDPDVFVSHCWPPKMYNIAYKWVVMQPWEFTQVFKHHLPIYEACDELWTPSHYSKWCFVNSGINPDKIHVIPNGVDADIFKPGGQKIPSDHTYKFLFVGGTIYRKGIDILLKAYTEIFRPDDGNMLIIKDTKFYTGMNYEKHIPARKDILYLNENMSNEELAALYRTCDILVMPYRGEGFCLPVLEAMACGKPVIVTEGGATDDFVKEYKIPSEFRAIGHEMDGKPLTGKGYLLEPDYNSLCSLMKMAAREKPALKDFDVSKWTWQKATDKIIERLNKLMEKQDD